MLIILGFAKILSPNVDVGISSNDDTAISDIDDDDNSLSAVDDRLRKLKMEDEGKKEGNEDMFSPELDERVVLPQQKHKTVGEIEAERNTAVSRVENKIEETQNNSHQISESVTVSKPQAPVVRTEVVNARVVVGYYATEKQAEVAKSIIQDAGLNVVPVVKNMGGYYTLQVGSYSSREKAQQAANGLLKSNFPARVIVD
jgi:cell division protein FtsN